MNTYQQCTDGELSALDVPTLIRYGIAMGGAHRAVLFGEGAVAAGLAADRLGVIPRSLGFLAEVVRSGGTRYAADLPEPLPGAAPAGLAREWLATAAAVVQNVDGDETLARWLEAVAAILALRRSVD
ncbi:hypothetical protein [Kitasatospora sp. NPDC050543]|uniref:hypothetical protein n=1 Tax=Kitasatospora sp. NPDC050543 TaxID=3364054 RepID=UPI00378D7F41